MKQGTRKRTAQRTPGRRKLSTTISAETYGYLEGLVKCQRVRNLAEAVDSAVEHVRRAESRAQLEQETKAYFEALSPAAVQEERDLERALDSVVGEVDLDA